MRTTKSTTTTDSRKRPVNLTLNEDLVMEARRMTDNLSGVVESLLTDFVARERRAQLERSKVIESTSRLWNDFNASHGSFADEHSTL